MNMPLPGLGAQPQLRTMVRNECCNKCKWHAALAGQANFECRRFPPTMSFMPTNHGPQPISAYPPVTPEHWCGEFKPGIEGVN